MCLKAFPQIFKQNCLSRLDKRTCSVKINLFSKYWRRTNNQPDDMLKMSVHVLNDIQHWVVNLFYLIGKINLEIFCTALINHQCSAGTDVFAVVPCYMKAFSTILGNVAI